MQTFALLPVFVYGTLRHGLGNYQRILAGHTLAEEPATLRGATMRDGGGCPFVSLNTPADPLGDVRGEIMHLDPATVADTMTRLDRLESFFGPGHPRNMYERVSVQVVRDSDGTPVTAYTYVTGRGFADWTEDMPVIGSGDWMDRRSGARSVVTA